MEIRTFFQTFYPGDFPTVTCVVDNINIIYLYVTKQSYQLTYRVFDEKHTNTTAVIINVLDVNDNPGEPPQWCHMGDPDVNDNSPKFDNAIYNVTNAVEEETGISKNNPKYLLTVGRLVSLYFIFLLSALRSARIDSLFSFIHSCLAFPFLLSSRAVEMGF